MHQRDPVGDLGDILHRGRQRHQRHVLGTADDDLLPDRPPPLVTHVVALVQDHGVEPREPARVEHVAEDLRGHDEHGSARIDLDVARQDPDLLRPELAAEVRVLLVGERLERRGVGDAPAAVERRVDGELRDERLARPGGRRDDDGLARAAGLIGLALLAAGLWWSAQLWPLSHAVTVPTIERWIRREAPHGSTLADVRRFFQKQRFCRWRGLLTKPHAAARAGCRPI